MVKDIDKMIEEFRCLSKGSGYDPEGMKIFVEAMDSDIYGAIFERERKDYGTITLLKIDITSKDFFKSHGVKGSGVTARKSMNGTIRFSDEECPDYWTPYAETQAEYFFIPMRIFNRFSESDIKTMIFALFR